MDNPRNIFSARTAPTESRSYPLGPIEDMVGTCIKCGSQELYVTIQAPEPGDVGWALDPEQARAFAAEVVRVADEVEAENRAREADG